MTDPIKYIRQQLDDGVAYVILPNVLAEIVSGRIMELELDAQFLRSEIEVLQRMRHEQLRKT